MPEKLISKPVQINAKEVTLKYANDVANGTLIAGKLLRLAANRFLDDLKHGHERGLRMDWKAGQKVVNFICQLQHTKGNWDSAYIVPAPWQVFVITNLFGWKNKFYLRRFREAYIEVARKNGKSTTLAGIGLYLLTCDNEPGARVYSAATTKEQAYEVFEVATDMVKKDSWLTKQVELTGKKKPNCAYVLNTSSQFKPLPYEGSGKGSGDGKNVSGAILDELHQHPDGGQYALLKQGMLSRKQGMLIAITTAGTDRHGICYHTRERHEKILARGVPLEECDSVFSFICCADQEDDDKWYDEKVWAKANPCMGISFNISYLRDEANVAKHQPSELNEFKRKHLCLWTSAETRCIDPIAWAACNSAGPGISPIKLRAEALQALRSEANNFGAFDLSEKIDLSAFVLVAAPSDIEGTWKFIPWFWMPELEVQRRVEKDKLPYDVWIREGFIETTPGHMINYGFIRKKIKELQEQYQLREVAYDKAYAHQLSIELQEDGVKLRECRQGMLTMTDPTKDFLARIVSKKIEHFGNPVLSWMSDNMVVTRDAAGGMKPDKEHAKEKIDGIVAAIMAMWCAAQNPIVNDDPYKDRGILFI